MFQTEALTMAWHCDGYNSYLIRVNDLTCFDLLILFYLTFKCEAHCFNCPIRQLGTRSKVRFALKVKFVFMTNLACLLTQSEWAERSERAESRSIRVQTHVPSLKFWVLTHLWSNVYDVRYLYRIMCSGVTRRKINNVVFVWPLKRGENTEKKEKAERSKKGARSEEPVSQPQTHGSGKFRVRKCI